MPEVTSQEVLAAECFLRQEFRKPVCMFASATAFKKHITKLFLKKKHVTKTRQLRQSINQWKGRGATFTRASFSENCANQPLNQLMRKVDVSLCSTLSILLVQLKSSISLLSLSSEGGHLDRSLNGVIVTIALGHKTDTEQRVRGTMDLLWGCSFINSPLALYLRIVNAVSTFHFTSN